MRARVHWAHSDVWSQLAPTPECSFNMGDWQSERNQWSCDWRAECNTMHGIDTGRGVICHKGFSDGCDGAHPLWHSDYAWTEMYFSEDTPSVTAIGLMHSCRAVIDPCNMWGSFHTLAKDSRIHAISVVCHDRVSLEILSQCSDTSHVRTSHYHEFPLNVMWCVAQCSWWAVGDRALLFDHTGINFTLSCFPR